MPEYIPAENGYLIAQLPGERLRAIIRQVVTPDAVIVELTSIPLAKSHTYKRGDYVACRRNHVMGTEEWKAVEDQRISIEDLVEKEIKVVKLRNKVAKVSKKKIARKKKKSKVKK